MPGLHVFSFVAQNTQLLWVLRPGPSTPTQSSGFSLNCATEPLSDSRSPVVPKNTGELDSCEDLDPARSPRIAPNHTVQFLSVHHAGKAVAGPYFLYSPVPSKPQICLFIAGPCSSSLSVPNPSSFLYCSSLRRVILLDSYQAMLLKTE